MKGRLPEKLKDGSWSLLRELSAIPIWQQDLPSLTFTASQEGVIDHIYLPTGKFDQKLEKPFSNIRHGTAQDRDPGAG